MSQENPLKGHPLVVGFKHDKDGSTGNTLKEWKDQTMRPMWVRFNNEENTKDKAKNLELILNELLISTLVHDVQEKIQNFYQKLEEIKTKEDFSNSDSELEKLGIDVKNLYEGKGNF